MSKPRQTRVAKNTSKSPKKTSPDTAKRINERGRPTISNLELEGTYLSKTLSAQIEQKNQIIHLLREQNLSLHNEVKNIKGKRKKLNKIVQNFNSSGKHMLIQDESLDELEEINVIFEICQKLEGILDEKTRKDLALIAKISKDFVGILKNDPNSSKNIQNSMKVLQQNMKSLTQTYLQEELSKNLINFKESLKKQREALKAALQEIISTNIKQIQEKQENILAKQLQILNSLPASLKELKQASKKREQDHKKQVTFLQKKIMSLNEENRQTIDSQNNLIQQLRESLSKLKEVYNKQIQIPLLNIRQTVQKEIRIVKAEFQNMHESTTLSVLIGDLINSLNKYTQSKNMANNEQMRDEIKKINNKLSLVNDQSIQTISKVRQIIKSSTHITFDYDFMAKAHKKEDILASRKRENEELGIQIRYEKQKEYIEMLQKYNKKLEQSVMRTQKQQGKHLYDQWKAIQGQYRAKQKQYIGKLNFIQSEVTTAKSEIIQIKKTAMAILHTQKSLTSLFQSFESEIVSIKSFKDQLFNFLENELKFRQQINKQVQLFNSMFVDKYSKMSQLQSIVPPIPQQQPGFTNHHEFCTAIANSINNYNQFKQDYEAVFKSKTNIDIKFHKYFTSIATLQDQYSKIAKNRTNNFTLELNFQPIKAHLNTAILKIQDLLSNTRVFKQAILKMFNSLKSDLHINNEQFQKILKFIKQSRLMDTVRLASQLFEGKNRILREVQQLLSQFTGSKVQVDPAQDSIFSSHS